MAKVKKLSNWPQFHSLLQQYFPSSSSVYSRLFQVSNRFYSQSPEQSPQIISTILIRANSYNIMRPVAETFLRPNLKTSFLNRFPPNSFLVSSINYLDSLHSFCPICSKFLPKVSSSVPSYIPFPSLFHNFFPSSFIFYSQSLPQIPYPFLPQIPSQLLA